MKVVIYDNKGKDVGGVWLKKLQNILDQHEIEHKQIEDKDLVTKVSADALFVLGGDGTILFMTEFASKTFN